MSHPAATVDPAVLADIEAIKRIKASYGDIIDRMVRMPEQEDRDRLAALFTEDAVLDFHEMLGRHEGREAIVRFFAEALPAGTAWMWHSFHSPLITVNGDEAEGRWTLYAMAVPKGAADPTPMLTYGRYTDRYVRTADGWRQSFQDFLDETRR